VIRRSALYTPAAQSFRGRSARSRDCAFHCTRALLVDGEQKIPRSAPAQEETRYCPGSPRAILPHDVDDHRVRSI
jgi:hypothetical protein